ncbi:MAG: saccharopine dehydrogenase NADP-binding domain-containing protein [Anaerolineales bacterium]|nr:saccharopine dehydrogenase NADP-binding domain-containing protein [Anaerolineales bacterium]
MRALVLGGAGAVCKETTRDLSKYSHFDEIVIADYNLEAVNKLINELADERLKPLFFNAEDYQGMLELFPQFNIIVNGLPFQFDLAVNKACVEVGVNGLDLSSEDPQFQLHQQAVQNDMLFVPGVGATPGITNMMVRRATEMLESVDEVEIYFAAFRCLAPAPGLLETTLWEFNPEEEDRQSVYFEDGHWHPAPPLSGVTLVNFHPQIGPQNVYYVPHDEVDTLPRSFPSLCRVAVRGCFPPHVMQTMEALMQAGLLSVRKIKLGDQEFPSIDVIRTVLAASEFSKKNDNWGYGLVVEVTGRRNQRQVKCTYRSQHPAPEVWGKEAAYYKNVGVPLSIGAQLIADGQVDVRGVLPPEMVLPVRPFFEALALRGITVEEQIVEEGQL